MFSRNSTSVLTSSITPLREGGRENQDHFEDDAIKIKRMTTMQTVSPLPSSKEAELANARIRELREKLMKEKYRAQDRLTDIKQHSSSPSSSSPVESLSGSPPMSTGLQPRLSPAASSSPPPLPPASPYAAKIPAVITPHAAPPSPGGESSVHSTASHRTAQSMQGLLRKIGDLESRLSVANRVAEFLKSDTTSQAIAESSHRSMTAGGVADDGDMQMELDQLHKRLQEKEVLLQQRQGESKRQEATVQQLQTELQAVQQQLARQESGTRSNNKEQQQQLQATISALQQQLQDSQQAAVVLKQAQQAAQGEKDSLAKEVQTLQSQVNDWQAQATAANQAQRDLEGRLEQVQAELTAAQQSTRQVQEQAQSQQTNAQALQELQTELQTVQALVQQKDDKIQLGQEQFAAQSAQMQALQQEMDDLEDHLNHSYNETLDQLTKQIGILEGKLEESRKQTQELQEASSLGSASQQELQDNMDELKIRCKTLTRQLQDKDTALDEATATCKQHESKITSLQDELAEMEDHLNKSYSDSLDLMVKQISELKGRLVESDQQASVLQETASKAQQSQLQAEANAENSQAQCVRLQAEVKAGQQELQVAQEKCTVATEKLTGLQSKLQALQTELADAKTNVRSESPSSSSSQDTNNWEEQIASLEQRLADSAKVLQFLQTTAKQAQEDSQAHKDKATELQEKLASLQSELAEKTSELSETKEQLETQTALTAEAKQEVADLQKEQEKLLLQLEENEEKEEEKPDPAVDSEATAKLEVEISALKSMLALQEEEKTELLAKHSKGDVVLQSLEDLSKQICNMETKLDRVEAAENVVARSLGTTDDKFQRQRIFLLAAILMLSTVTAIIGAAITLHDPKVTVAPPSPTYLPQQEAIPVMVDTEPVILKETESPSPTLKPTFLPPEPDMGATCLLWEHGQDDDGKARIFPDAMASAMHNFRLDREVREHQGDRTDYTEVAAKHLRKTGQQVSERIQDVAAKTSKVVAETSDKVVHQVANVVEQTNVNLMYTPPANPVKFKLNIIAAITGATSQLFYTPPAETGQCQCF